MEMHPTYTPVIPGGQDHYLMTSAKGQWASVYHHFCETTGPITALFHMQTSSKGARKFISLV